MNAYDILLEHIKNGRFELAQDIAFNHINNFQNNENFVILFILFKIRKNEIDSGETDIFSSPLGHEPDTLLYHYKILKLLVRRFEYDMPPEALDDAIQYFIENKVSMNALYTICGFACVDAENTYQKLAEHLNIYTATH